MKLTLIDWITILMLFVFVFIMAFLLWGNQ